MTTKIKAISITKLKHQDRDIDPNELRSMVACGEELQVGIWISDIYKEGHDPRSSPEWGVYGNLIGKAILAYTPLHTTPTHIESIKQHIQGMVLNALVRGKRNGFKELVIMFPKMNNDETFDYKKHLAVKIKQNG